MIGGTVFGSLAFVVLFTIGFWCCLRRRLQRRWHIEDDGRDALRLIAVGVGVVGVSPFLIITPNLTVVHYQ
jgi:hypothetical protein